METPLSYTAEGGHEGVVQIPLEQAKDSFNLIDSLKKSCVLVLLGMVHDGVVKTLLTEPILTPTR